MGKTGSPNVKGRPALPDDGPGIAPTPTLDKLSAADDRRRAALDFVEWLNENGIHLASWWEPTYETLEGPIDNERPVTRKMAPELTYTRERADALVMRWLGIDPRDVERERRALLDSIRPIAETGR